MIEMLTAIALWCKLPSSSNYVERRCREMILKCIEDKGDNANKTEIHNCIVKHKVGWE